MSKIIELSHKLQFIYDALNKKYFDDELPDVMLTVMTNTKATKNRRYDSWFYPCKWEDRDGNPYHEINIDPQILNSSTLEIATLMQHAMIHLHCFESGIKDTSRNFRYHNDKFSAEAMSKGLICEKEEGYGWMTTIPSDDFKDFIKDTVPENYFEVIRIAGDVPPPII